LPAEKAMGDHASPNSCNEPTTGAHFLLISQRARAATIPELKAAQSLSSRSACGTTIGLLVGTCATRMMFLTNQKGDRDSERPLSEGSLSKFAQSGASFRSAGLARF
jgi:hypothetical protein